MWGHSLLYLFARGGLVMWPLLAASIVALAIIVERTVVFLCQTRLNFQRLRDRLEPLVRARRLDDAISVARSTGHPVARIAATYLAHVAGNAELRGEIVGREASEQIARLGRRLPTLATIGQLAPMLGLLGTVTGLVTAFWQIEIKAGQVQPSDLASGIWEALLTTVFGLVIAIPTLALYHAFDQRLAAIEVQIRWMAAYLDEWLGLAPAKAAERPQRERPAERKQDDPMAIGVS